MDFSVVIPVYNEEKLVGEAIRRVEAFMALKKWDWELLICSDGSTDATDRIVRERAAQDPRVKLLAASPNKGKGAAARRGMLAAKGRYVLMTDVDLSSPVKESDKLVEAIDAGHDVAIGSRAVRRKGADVQQSVRRQISGRIFNFFVKRLVTSDFHDTQCGFKLFTRDAAQALFKEQKLDGFAFDVEILYIACKKGLKVAEVPVMWRQGKDSKVNVFKDSFVMVGDLMKIKKLHAAILFALICAGLPAGRQAFAADELESARREADRSLSSTLKGYDADRPSGLESLDEEPVIIDAQDWDQKDLDRLEGKGAKTSTETS